MFVSHGAEAVRLLCERAIWLHQGKLLMDERVEPVLDAYEAMVQTGA